MQTVSRLFLGVQKRGPALHLYCPGSSIKSPMNRCMERGENPTFPAKQHPPPEMQYSVSCSVAGLGTCKFHLGKKGQVHQILIQQEPWINRETNCSHCLTGIFSCLLSSLSTLPASSPSLFLLIDLVGSETQQNPSSQGILASG